MQINGFNDFQQLRRSAGKDDVKAAGRAYAAAESAAAASEETGDAVDISPMGRHLAKLRQLPDARPEVVEKMRAKIAAGELDTPEALERGVSKMLSSLFSGEID